MAIWQTIDKPLRRYGVLSGTVLSLGALVVACGGDSSSDNSEEVSVDAVKSNYVAMAGAAYQDSLTTAQALQTAVDAFIADPTDENLQAAKAAYKETRVPYQQSEIMRFDTAITEPADLTGDGVGPQSVDDWEGQVNAWPLDENFIEDKVNTSGIIYGDQAITTELLIAQNGAEDNEANVTTGVHAVEFMLWGQDLNGTNPGAGERPATDYANDGSCADAYCERRAQYLKTATDLLVDDLTEMAAEWTEDAANTQGSLAYNFINSDLAIDYIWGSIFSMATDELAGARINEALTTGATEEEHDCFSDLSHVAIYNNFQGVKNAFYGRYGDISGASFGDLIKQKDQATYDTFDASLSSIEEKMQVLLDAGEREENTVRFDQIIGQDETGVERQTAEAVVLELVGLDAQLQTIRELLSLQDLNPGGGGDGD